MGTSGLMSPIDGRQPIKLRDRITYLIAEFGLLFASEEYRAFNRLVTSYGLQELDRRLVQDIDLTP